MPSSSGSSQPRDQPCISYISYTGRQTVYHQSHLKVKVRLFVTPWTIQSMEFSGPEYWTGQPFPSPCDFPNQQIESKSPSLQADSLPAEPQGKPKNIGVGSLSLLQQIYAVAIGVWRGWRDKQSAHSSSPPAFVLSCEIRDQCQQGAAQKTEVSKCSSFLKGESKTQICEMTPFCTIAQRWSVALSPQASFTCVTFSWNQRVCIFIHLSFELLDNNSC